MIDMRHLPDEVRSGLLPEVRTYISALEAAIDGQNLEINALRSEVNALRSQSAARDAQLQALQVQVTELQARLGQTSQNSSRPPSSDPPGAPPRPERPPSGRKRGGQLGHKFHERPLLPESELKDVFEHRAETCPECQAALAADLPDTGELVRQQVWYLPDIQPAVVEHRYHEVTCPQCGAQVQAARPVEVPPGAFGPEVVALIGLLHGRFRLSVREVVVLLRDVFHLPISAGAVIHVCQVLSKALATPYAKSQTAAARAGNSNVDETGWKQGGKRGWLWVMVTVSATIFMVATQRSAAYLRELLGKSFQGIVTSDRAKAYLTLSVKQRQVCWSHLKRNWVAFSELPDPLAAWAQQALAQIHDLFVIWHRFKNGELDRAGLQTAMQPVQTQLRQLLKEGRALPLHKVRAFCDDLLDLWPALWTFLAVEGVEPTNNAAERALRPAVLWRKGCFGTQSDGGSMFVARILTVVTTCRQQDRQVLPFLTDSVRAYWNNQPAPVLCPAPWTVALP
jgi:transposase